MKLICPHCNFSREIPDEKIPDRPVKVTCPKCEQGFTFDKGAAVAASAFDEDFGAAAKAGFAPAAEPPPARTVCPACGLEQTATDRCEGCGVIYARWAARHGDRSQAGTVPPPPRPDASFPGQASFGTPSPADRPKAGFWIRGAASIIDGLILAAVQFVLNMGLLLASGGDEESITMIAITWLCSMAVSTTYYVYFTGYNGQTPGKMALRIQVVRTDGSTVGYGKAFLREVLGKFVSAIILCIGYLMAAFDRDKQALHDRIAGTYVIKL